MHRFDAYTQGRAFDLVIAYADGEAAAAAPRGFRVVDRPNRRAEKERDGYRVRRP